MHDHGKSPLAADRQIIPRSKHMNYQWQRAVGFMGKVAGGSRVQVPAGRLHTGKARDTPRHYISNAATQAMDSQLCLMISHKAQSPAMHISVDERGTHTTGRDEAGRRGEKNNIQSSIQQMAAQEKKQRQQGGISRGQVQA